jgi:DNA-binding IclR family transcriptional regulator
MFAIPADECVRVLTTLVREGFLRCAPDGQYRIMSRG